MLVPMLVMTLINTPESANNAGAAAIVAKDMNMSFLLWINLATKVKNPRAFPLCQGDD